VEKQYFWAREAEIFKSYFLFEVVHYFSWTNTWLTAA